jgi:hypothetical protein
MFPRLREQIGTALDLFVEFSTLGEYRLAAEAIPGASSAPVDAPSQAPQLGGAGVYALRAAVRHTVAGGAAGSTPVATPAARRLMQAAKAAEPARPAEPPHGPLRKPPHASATGSGASRSGTRPGTASGTRPGTASGTRPGTACAGDRRRPADATAARSRARTGAPAVAEQLCLAV